ncbi:echinoidin-like [Strongylocentrotus purpuratus]|uniref:C-type lectin domain-containing protein n=1 Tax=Strongylocentrotus purpuratus TaxID=7668 RepID=A0A7M7G0Q4_STRPU|nr:echinoidin-like [Strongylocentrotus purpuratus]|eukprot:XP_001186224.1 PREDICTED: echinoidin-like [Strongylocentrotus purpuratus]
MTALLFIGVVTVMLASPSGVRAGCCCPSMWTSFGRHCYRFFSYNLTWEAAEMICRTHSVPSLGDGDLVIDSLGHLVSIHSRQENDFVDTLFKSSYKKQGVGYMWIGFHDATSDASHEWIDGTDSDYTNWFPGQPDGTGREDCTEMVSAFSGDWNDVSCTSTRQTYFICKLPSWS